MEKILLVLIVTLFSGCHTAVENRQTNDPTFFDPLNSSQQVVLVTTPDWKTTPGTLHCFERVNSGAGWQEAQKGFPIVVGRNGLGWGKGIHPPVNFSGPIKKEGDGKSPAGIFRLSSAFGISEKSGVIKLPYRQLTAAIECVDDVKSGQYNSIVDREKIPNPDWQSSEKMRAMGECYRLGIVVDHNVVPREAGGGSCIFLHIWKARGIGTSGCTAMAEENIEKLLSWLDPKKNPVLVQLPVTEYRRLRKEWSLP